MANTSAPFGLRPVRSLNGAPWNGAATLYYIPSTDTNAYNVGDVVASLAGGDVVSGASSVVLVGTRNAATTSGTVRGVIVGMGTNAGNSGAQAPLGADDIRTERGAAHLVPGKGGAAVPILDRR